LRCSLFAISWASFRCPPIRSVHGRRYRRSSGEERGDGSTTLAVVCARGF